MTFSLSLRLNFLKNLTQKDFGCLGFPEISQDFLKAVQNVWVLVISADPSLLSLLGGKRVQ